ncbi:MAG TPA: glycosyltransferase 87 family protein [Chloroflexota bacterium]|nr:glycosyltransferase 87 family protein [Chloroflexota bacterium]
MTRHGLTAGIAIEIIYLAAALGPFALLSHGNELTDLGKLTAYQPSAAVLVTAGLVLLFILYGIALLAVTGTPRAVPLAIGGTVLFSGTLVLLYPVSAIDVYNYAVQGHVALFHRLNPLVTAPATVTNDPFVGFAGMWAQSTSPYGPLWILLTVLDARLAGPNVTLAVLLLKGLAALAVIGTTVLLAGAFADRGPRASALAAVFFGWNPLVQIEMVGNGHNDAILTFFLVFALVLLKRRHTIPAALAMGASVLIKYITVGVVPFFLLAQARTEADRPLRRRIRDLIASLAVMIGLAAGTYAPFWSGTATIERALAVDANFLSSIPALLILLLPGAASWLTAARLCLLGMVCLWGARALHEGKIDPARAALEVLFVTILAASHFAGWYLAPLVALAALGHDWWVRVRIALFTFTTTLATPIWAYLWWWNQATMSLTTIHLIVVPLTFLPALAMMILASQRSHSGTARSDARRRTRLAALSAGVRNAYLTARSAVGSSS